MKTIDFSKYAICFETPERLTDIAGWHAHMPFAFAIMQMLCPKIFVELGTHKGDAYCAFCQAAEKLNLDCSCYAVDSWRGDKHAGFYEPEIFEEFREYHEPLYRHFSKFLKMQFDEALACFADKSIDLLHIDGLHQYEAVKHDFYAWLPKMSRKGVILLHDTQVYKNNFGVWKLWKEIKDKYPNFEFTHSHGLGVLGVGESPSHDIMALLNSEEETADWIRSFFSSLGKKITQEDYIRKLPDMTEIEDYYPHNMKRRYGNIVPYQKEIYEILSRKIVGYEHLMKQFAGFADQFLSVEKYFTPENPNAPHWINSFFPPLDAIALFGMISVKKPAIYLEIGGGHSTRFAAEAVKRNSPSTRIISLDPRPRAEIDGLCDTMIRKPLEECDMALFDELSPNDILFFDGSHRVLQNSDNTVFFFDVIPRTVQGVYIHLHDIFWPFDYPDEWRKRMYSEQYVLGSMLLYGHDRLEVVLPNTFISWQTELLSLYNCLWNVPHFDGLEKQGTSFWFVKV
ncbi:MAG: hypothetical protein B6245_02925 [Desulfobacteraceae bacterium 4572_88]|nr:MAG: hypothetical protein B6245_02925 [Desulfobacteraceae bacterium 4572_88]